MKETRSRTKAAPAVGVVGLGIMGGAYSRHLLSAGFRVTGYDVLAARQAALRKLGGVPAASPAAVAHAAAIVITSLPSVDALDDALFGEQGVAAGAAKGGIVIEASTLPLAVKEKARKRLAGAGMTMLDCPVSGTGAQAAVKDIAVYASGERRAFTRCRPVFAGFARSAYYCGAFGTGSKLKFIANLLVTIHNLSTAEAMVLAERGGVDLDLVYRVIKDGAGTSRMFEVRGPLMVKRTYLPATMKVDVYQKDISIIKAYAKSLRCPTPLFTVSEAFYDEACAQGFTQHDTAVIHEVLRQRAGLRTKDSRAPGSAKARRSKRRP